MNLEARACGPGWHCPRFSDLELRSWNDGAVVYDDRGAFLHLLTPIAGEILALLLKPGVHDAFELARALIQEDPADDELALIRALLDSLSSMDLIERLPA